MMPTASLFVHAMVSVAIVWVLLLRFWPRRRRLAPATRTAKIQAGALTLLVLLVPLGELSLWHRGLSLYPNPSLPMLGIVSAALWSELYAVRLFRRTDWNAIWIFGAVGGSLLYRYPIIGGGVDVYYWGWERHIATGILATVTVGLLGWGSRLGVLMLAALVTYGTTALESQNCWDYVLDPGYWLLSVAVVAMRLGRALGRLVERTNLLARWTGSLTVAGEARGTARTLAAGDMNDPAAR